MSTERLRVTENAIERLVQHISRFGPDPANEAMVARLRAIASGGSAAEPVDLNFYAHELRESVRYRRLGVPPGGGTDRETWNNAHTATLEDYRLNERSQPHPLYHADALAAG